MCSHVKDLRGLFQPPELNLYLHLPVPGFEVLRRALLERHEGFSLSMASDSTGESPLSNLGQRYQMHMGLIGPSKH